MRTTLIGTFVLLFAAVSFSAQLPADSPVKRDLAQGPINTVSFLSDPYVVFTCRADNPGARIQWIEYTHTPSGGYISDNEFLQPGAPAFDRYSLNTSMAGQYDLRISPIVTQDAGVYRCIDSNASPISDTRSVSIQYTILESDSTGSGWNCSTTIRETGSVIEGTYVTNDCTVNYWGGLIPNLTWSGSFEFVQAYVAADTMLWAGMHFNATRDMMAQALQLTLYFTQYLPPIGDFATNVPSLVDVFQTRQMYIYWSPKDMDVGTEQEYYLVGDTLLCNSDAFPLASHAWQNLRTLEVFTTQVLTVQPHWYGTNQTMRCQALNTIEGVQYTNNIFINLWVPVITDPPTTPPTTTTTPPPAVAPCTDLTGQWIAQEPMLASLCIRLNLTNNAYMTGLLKNGTQTFWLDLVGRAQSGNYAQIGFNGIWPATIGMSSFVGECHRCFGEEVLLINVVSRQKGAPCGNPGPVQYSEQFRFRRNPLLQCPNLPQTMLQ